MSADAARLTTLTREKITESLVLPESERLPVVIEALDAAVGAINALTERLLADPGPEESDA